MDELKGDDFMKDYIPSEEELLRYELYDDIDKLTTFDNDFLINTKI